MIYHDVSQYCLRIIRADGAIYYALEAPKTISISSESRFDAQPDGCHIVVKKTKDLEISRP